MKPRHPLYTFVAGLPLMALAGGAHVTDVNEQPFTRCLGGVTIPPGGSAMRVRARDAIHGHGHGGREMAVRVPD